MKHQRLVSVVVLLAAVVVGVAVADYIGMLFALMVLSTFLLSFILLPFSLIGLSLSPQHVLDTTRNERTIFPLKVVRRSFFPCGKVKIVFLLRNRFNGFSTKETVIIRPVKGESILSCPIQSPHIGMIDITVWRIWVYDLTGLIAVPLKGRGTTAFYTLPEGESVWDGAIVPQETEDNEETDPSRPGNSRPELFGVHEYIFGDSIRDIHWKLSARLDKMMVREYVRPIHHDVSLLLLNGGGGISPMAADKLMDVLFTLSLSLLQSNISHTLCWCEAGQMTVMRIQEENEIFLAVKRILSVRLCTSLELIEFLSGTLPLSSFQVVLAATTDERVGDSVRFKERDALLFVGETAPDSLFGRAPAVQALSEDKAESPKEAIAALLYQGVH